MKIYKRVVDSKGQSVAKHVQEIFDILKKYYSMMQDGTHVNVIPDPFYDVPDDDVNHLIEELDADFEAGEAWRRNSSQMISHMPDFFRLSLGARRAMYQEIQEKFEYQKKHFDEYFDEIEVTESDYDMSYLYDSGHLVNESPEDYYSD